MRHLFPASTAAIFLLGGCAVGPRYVAPVSSAPSAYVGGAAVEARPSIAAVDMVEWWRSFHDPLLTSLVERALAQNLDLQQARARIVQARAALKTANAALLPSGQINGQVGETYQSLQTPIGRIGSAFPQFERATETYELNAGASWELDLFGGRDAARDAARADWQASAAAAVAARLAVAAQTADNYIAIRTLQARLDVARSQAETQQRLVDLIALQYKKGLAAELQLRQVEGALSQVQASVPALQNELDIAMNALDVLLGVQPGTTRPELTPVTPIPTAPAISTAGGPAELLRRRPDIIAAERTLAATNARIGVAVSEYYPKFSLSGLLGSATTAAGGLFSGGATQANGVLGLRWRLFDFGRVDAEIRGAKGRNAEALAAYRLTVLRASQDVEDAFSTLVQQEARSAALTRGEVSLARARGASFAAYKGGVSSLIDVLDADRRLLETRDGAIQARAAASRGAVASFRALGGGWDASARLYLHEAPYAVAGCNHTASSETGFRSFMASFQCSDSGDPVVEPAEPALHHDILDSAANTLARITSRMNCPIHLIGIASTITDREQPRSLASAL